MATRMQQRRGTAADWQSANTLLAQGEIGYETDTNKFKIGDGVTAWNSLGYFVNAAEILDGAPGTLDTLNELAAAINDDPDFFNSITNTIDGLTTGDIPEGEGYAYFTDILSITSFTNIISVQHSEIEPFTPGQNVKISGANYEEFNTEYYVSTYSTTVSSLVPLDGRTFVQSGESGSSAKLNTLQEIKYFTNQGIDALSDVDTSAKQDGYVLTYNGTSSEWEASAPTGGSGGTADDNAIFKATLFFGGN